MGCTFEVGDTVRKRIGQGTSSFPIGESKEVLDITDGTRVWFLSTATGNKIWCEYSQLELVKKKTKREQKTMKRSTKYSFEAPWVSVDASLILDSMSYSNPLAIITDEDGNGFVMIHESIEAKAEVCNIPMIDMMIRFDKDTINVIQEVKDFIKRVKDSKYPSTCKRKKIQVEVLRIG